MTRAWCVRVDWGIYTAEFRRGGYVAVGWNEIGHLRQDARREGLYPLYRAVFPDDSVIVTGQQVGQIARLGLINGDQLADLLVEHWDTIPVVFQEKLGLKPGGVLEQ